MTLDQTRALAASKGYTFSNAIVSPPANDWVTYVLMSEGPVLSLCRGVVSSVSKQYTSNTHEFVSLLSRWAADLGPPAVKPSQFYVQGRQNSQIEFSWTRDDKIRRTLSLGQFGNNSHQISYGFFQVDHPCRT